MLISHKVALRPNNKQATCLAKSAGCARFAYNWALDQWNSQYQAHKENNALPKPNQMALRRRLNAIKRTDYPWMLEVTKCAPQLAIMQLGQAFQNFFAKRAKRPVFRKKGVRDRFSLSSDQFAIKGKKARLPHIGYVRMAESLRFEGKIMSAAISRTADRWYISITVDTPDQIPAKAESQGAVGVDLGVSHLATLSTGEKIAGPKPHKALLNRLRRLSRSLSRKQKGSKNRQKAKDKLSRLHARISNIRNDALHKLTSEIVKRFILIGIEDLNTRGMLKNRHLSRSIADMGFFEFKRQLEYKSQWNSRNLFVVDRFYASSKLCSNCGYKKVDLTLKDREWDCSQCSAHHDRDINAAVNLRNLAVSSTASACGEGSAGSGHEFRVKLPSVKQEFNDRFVHV